VRRRWAARAARLYASNFDQALESKLMQALGAHVKVTDAQPDALRSALCSKMYDIQKQIEDLNRRVEQLEREAESSLSRI
jgi:hypothetical protein